MNYTLNIGMLRGTLPMNKGDVLSEVAKVFGVTESDIEHKFIPAQAFRNTEETLVARVHHRGVVDYFYRTHRLAIMLGQRAIAGYLSGAQEVVSGRLVTQACWHDREGQFDQSLFITMEQAMSYGSPHNPARLSAGDLVKLKDQRAYGGFVWGGKLVVVDPSVSNGVTARTANGKTGWFSRDELEPYLEPTPGCLTARVAALEAYVSELQARISLV